MAYFLLFPDKETDPEHLRDLRSNSYFTENGFKTQAPFFDSALSASMLFLFRHTSLLSDDMDFVTTRH